MLEHFQVQDKLEINSDTADYFLMELRKKIRYQISQHLRKYIYQIDFEEIISGSQRRKGWFLAEY